MTPSTAFEPTAVDGSGHLKNPRALALVLPGQRSRLLFKPELVDQAGDAARSCLGCGNISDLRGDPRRGYCLAQRRMVSGAYPVVCLDYNAIPWNERIRIPTARSACKSPSSAAADAHLVQSDSQDNAGCAPAATGPGAIDGSNPSGGCSTVRDTSRASYAALKASGALSRQQALLTAAMERWPYRTFTRQELRAEVGLDINVVTARVKELLDMGALVEVGKRICRVKKTEVHELRLAA